jgi:hypothetical protein
VTRSLEPEDASGQLRFFQGVTARGEAIVSDAPASNGATLSAVTVRLLDPPGGTRTLAGPVRSRQVGAVAAAGDTVVWTLTGSVSLYEADWQVYASTAGRAARLLGDSVTLTPGTTPSAPGYQPLSTDGGTAYWTAPRLVDGRPRASVYSAPVDGSRPARQLVPDAKLPVSTPGFLC